MRLFANCDIINISEDNSLKCFLIFPRKYSFDIHVMQTVFLEDNLHELYFQALLSGKIRHRSSIFQAVWLFCPQYAKIQCAATNLPTGAPNDTQISLRIRAVWSEFSLSAWKHFASLTIPVGKLYTVQMRRLIWIFAECTCPRVRFLMFQLKWAASCEYAGSEGPDQTAQSDLALYCPLTESLDTTECMNGE